MSPTSRPNNQHGSSHDHDEFNSVPTADVVAAGLSGPVIASAFEHAQQLIKALFHPSDLIEIRLVETWSDHGRRKSRLLTGERWWGTPGELAARFARLQDLNLRARANVFFGVNPRRRSGGGRKEDVALCRSLWIDLDDVNAEEALRRCDRAGALPPSITVSSGTGIHAYWLLERPWGLDDWQCRSRLERRIRGLGQTLDADATHDVTRLLRLPGLWNMKDARNGRSPRPCTLLWCDASRTYALQSFPDIVPPSSDTRFASETNSGMNGVTADIRIDTGRVANLVSRLDVPVADRSRRDYAIVCELLRSGLTAEQIRRLVGAKSKFASSGDAYLQSTLANAMRDVQSE